MKAEVREAELDEIPRLEVHDPLDDPGRYYAIAHQQHYVGLVGDDDRVQWAIAPQPVFEGVPNDLRRGPDSSIHVLDSKNFALRVIDLG